MALSLVLVLSLASVAVVCGDCQRGVANGTAERRSRCLASEERPQSQYSGTARESLAWARLLRATPPLDAHVPGISATCRRQLDAYFADLQRLRLWAVQMYDSTAKLPSGFLSGNVNQLGHFEQCLAVVSGGSEEEARSARRERVQGKYCLASLQLRLDSNASDVVRTMHMLMHSHYLFTSDLDDPSHRVPRFSSISWGVCVPAGCSGSDVEAALRRRLRAFVADTSLSVDVRVDEGMCQVKQERVFSAGTLLTGGLFVCIILVIASATLYHVQQGEKIGKAIKALSLKNNVEKLLEAGSVDDIGCVHGIRFFNSVMLIISHKSLAFMFLPFVNRTIMAENIARPSSVVSRAASLYTDPFIMLSGLLTTKMILRRLHRQGYVCLADEYLSRFIRVIPPLAALILFCTWIMPHMDSGPMWNQVVTHHSDICKQYWWRNMLFIHNYYGFRDMCLTHTHHMGIDMQLFVATPPVVLALWQWPRRTTRALLAAAALSTVARYVVTRSLGLSNYVAVGASIKQLFATADHMYILPAYRATVYIMGVLLGYLLHNSKKVALSKTQLNIGWAVSFVLLGVSFVGTSKMSVLGYEYEASQAANYAAFSPITWCAFFAWVIYTSHLGYTNWITKALSWKRFALWTKISYSVYLTQFPLFFYYVGVARTPLIYRYIEQLVNLKEFFYIILVSIILTLFIEMPSQNLRNIYLRRHNFNNSEKIKEALAEEFTGKDDFNNAVKIVERFSHRHIEDHKMK